MHTSANERAVGRAESRIIIAGFVLYMVALTAYLVAHGRFPTVDFLVPALLPLALRARRGRTFILDWLPFVLFLLAYEQARGLAAQFSNRAHVMGVVNLERWMFGDPVPTVRLQSWLWQPDRTMPWDVLATTLYLLHFVVPVALGYLLWRRSRALYWRYVLGLLLVAYAGFLTYVLYPQAPPWLASNGGYIPPLHDVLVHTMNEFELYQPFFTVYEHIDPNPVAAMPSLHIAFPVYVYLVTRRCFPGRWGPWLVLYPLAVTAAVVYMGEHFVVDCIAGALYAVVGYWLTWDGPRLFRSHWSRWRTHAPVLGRA